MAITEARNPNMNAEGPEIWRLLSFAVTMTNVRNSKPSRWGSWDLVPAKFCCDNDRWCEILTWLLRVLRFCIPQP